MGRTLFFGLIAVACLVGLWVTQCSGPRPLVDGTPVLSEPEQPGQPYRVDVSIRNTGPGHGEVQLTVSLHDRLTDRTYQRIDKVSLEANDQKHVVMEIPAPPGDYQPQVEVEYPPG